MYPSFLDGAAATTPPELLDRVREAPKPKDDQSFESHLYRPQDVAETKSDTTEANLPEESPDKPVGETFANEGEAEANETNQEDANSPTEEADPSQEAETDNVEEESETTESNLKDDLLADEVDVLLETTDATPLEDVDQTELPDLVLGDQTPTVVTVEETVEETVPD